MIDFKRGDTVIIDNGFSDKYEGVVYRKWVNSFSGDISSIELYLPRKNFKIGDYWERGLSHGRILLTEKGFYCEV
jgi:hypothetical protein